MKIDELIEINKNNELKEILKLVKEDVVFLGENKRLLSKGEIENYKEELAITIDIIPLIDLGDNIFIVYDNSDEKFKKCNISEEILYGEIHSIEKYIEQIYENMFESHDIEEND